MNRNLKAGMIVNIYQQPFIERMFEGEAKLIEKVEGYTNLWRVRFLYIYDNEIVERMVVDKNRR